MGAELDVVGALGVWAAGWAAARRFEPPAVVGPGLRIDCEIPERPAEFFVPDDGSLAAIAEHARQIPGSWVSALTDDPARTSSVMSGLGIRPFGADESLMSIALTQGTSTNGTPTNSTSTNSTPTNSTSTDSAPPPAGFVVERAESAGVSTVCFTTNNSEVAASGLVAVVGDTAVFDRIETADAFRRRGLGSAVMGALTEAAKHHGATTGLLIATAMGQGLYTSLGWQQQTLLVTGVVPSD